MSKWASKLRSLEGELEQYDVLNDIERATGFSKLMLVATAGLLCALALSLDLGAKFASRSS